jgi:hypothetical protein
VTRNVRPSAQGGVVSEPVYWCRGVVCTCSIRDEKSRDSISVLVPGSAMAEREGARPASSGSEPSVESWKSAEMTARLDASAKRLG